MPASMPATMALDAAAAAADDEPLTRTQIAHARRIARRAPSVGSRLRQAGQPYTLAFAKALQGSVTESQYDVLEILKSLTPKSLRRA